MDLALLQQAWAIPGPWRTEPLTRGTNNIVQRVDTPAGGYVLRLYSNHTDAARLRFEQRILAQLATAGLPFAVPLPLVTMDGAYTIAVATEQGTALATLTAYIPGESPNRDDLDQATAAGEALGQLTVALASVDLEALQGAVSWRSSGDLAHCHPLVPDPPAAFAGLPMTDEARERLIAGYAWLIQRIPDVYGKLPQQLAHEDFDPGNVLMEGTRVTGVLDFEFCARDLRLMDLAVALTWWPVRRFGSGDEWAIIQSFVRGYARQITLTNDEIAALPLLFRLRAYTSLIHRLGRYRQGLSALEETLERAEAAIAREDWVRAHGERLIETLRFVMTHV